MKKFTAGANEDGVRLSRFVEGVTSGLPRSLLYKSFRNKRVKVNGRRAEPDARLAAGDVIELYINDEFFPEKPAPAAKPARRQPPVTVVYEDADIAVLYKPAHLLCHSDRTGDANLIDAFTAQLAAAGQYDPHAEQRFAPALCNRLDRGTEGLVIAAKNYAALRDMNEIIRNDWLKKEYLTITVGAPPAGRHIAWLQHSEKGNKVRIHARESEGYKQIITDVSVLRCQGPFALCRIGLVTGRTHQIRVHMAWQGHPLFNDERYGGDRILKGTTFAKYKQFIENCFALMPRHALHARTLGFAHPRTGEDLRFESALPEDFRQLVEKWDGYTASARQFLDDES